MAGEVSAAVTYSLTYGPNPFDPNVREKGQAWVLWRQFWIGQEQAAGEAVAVFNLDSEGRTFKAFLDAGGVVRT